MIDLHTQILPNVDDGSSSLEESLALLRMLASQGVTLTAATPHFYATSDAPEQFFRRRESAWQQLSAAMESGMPCVLLGAEVAFYRNISQMQQLERFCIGSSRLLLRTESLSLSRPLNRPPNRLPSRPLMKRLLPS